MIGCLAAAGLYLGRRRAQCRSSPAPPSLVVLVAGPWWGYAAARWHNPLQ